MPDINIKPEIALGIKQTDAMANLGSLIQTASGIQEFQKARELLPYAIEAGKAQSSSAKSAAEEAMLKVKQQQMITERAELEFNEQKNLANLMQSPELWQGADGKPDFNKLNKLVPMYAPRTGKEFLKGLTELSTAQTQNEQAALKLGVDEKQIIANRLQVRGRMGEQDPKVYLSDLEQLKEEFPKSKGMHEYIDSLKKMYSKVEPNQNIPGMAIRLAETFMSPSEFQPKSTTVETGAGTQFGTIKPSAGGINPQVSMTGPLVKRELGPGQRMVPNGRSDLSGRPLATVFNPDGSIAGEIVIPAGVQPQTSPNQPPAAPNQANPNRATPAPVQPREAPIRLPAGVTPAMYQESEKIRSDALGSSGTYQIQLENNNKIIDLAKKASTGIGAETLAAFAGQFTFVPWTGDKATYLNDLGHYLDQQAASLASGPGYGGTNAAREMAQSVSGKTNYTAQSIQNIARTNRALATGSYLFSQGIENGPADDPVYARKFKNKWNSVADVTSLRLIDATKNNDTEEINRLVQSLGGQNSEKYKKVKLNVKTILDMVRGGQ